MLPDIPTDSLYKFRTMTGLVALIFFLWMIHDNMVHDAENAALVGRLSAETQLSTLDGQQAQMALNHENEHNIRLKASLEKTPDLLAQITDSDKKKEDLRVKLQEVLQKMQAGEINRAIRAEEYQEGSRRGTIEYWVMVVGAVIAFIWTATGFRLWKKQQHYLDEILRKQSLAPVTIPSPPSS